MADLSVKYSVDGPEVLNKISFEIKPNERVGVVGRTGAGKSSLALSLLRFTEISNGSITINGLNIQNVNLEALRQRITYVPITRFPCTSERRGTDFRGFSESSRKIRFYFLAPSVPISTLLVGLTTRSCRQP